MLLVQTTQQVKKEKIGKAEAEDAAMLANAWVSEDSEYRSRDVDDVSG